MHDGIGHMVCPPGQTHPPGADPPGADTPSPEQTPLDGRCAGGTHPTGRHSCFFFYCYITDENFVFRKKKG